MHEPPSLCLSYFPSTVHILYTTHTVYLVKNRPSIFRKAEDNRPEHGFQSGSEEGMSHPLSRPFA
jgi:hypothetical protein